MIASCMTKYVSRWHDPCDVIAPRVFAADSLRLGEHLCYLSQAIDIETRWMMADYRYQPLPPIPETERSPPYTRIVWLAPGSGDEPLSAQLELVNAAQAPRPYEALSYTWGSDPPSNFLWLHGCALAIRPNLEAALLSLRLPTQPRLLWVDAICINQGDVDERSRQVQYMRLVYKHAARVVVWIGVKSPGVGLAFELARRLVDLREMVEEQKRSCSGVDPKAIQDLRDGILSDMPPDTLGRMYQLIQRAYFTRVWCVQEVVASKFAVLKCEELEIPFVDMVEHVILARHAVPTMAHDQPLHLWYSIWQAKHSGNEKSSAGVEGSLGKMLDLLDVMRPFHATDPRDKIFALQGISDEGIEPTRSMTQIMGKEGLMVRGIRRFATGLANTLNSFGPDFDFGRPEALKANYRKATDDVYIDLTRFMLRAQPRVLDVLDHVSHQTEPNPSDWPSWVPRWFENRSVQKMSGLYLAGFCKGHFRYFAEIHDNPLGGRANPLSGGARFPRTLSIDGYHVDVVQQASSVMQHNILLAAPTIASIERAWSELFPFPMTPSPSARYRDGGPLDVAFCKAISAHPFGDGVGISAESMHTSTSTAWTLPDNFKEEFAASVKDGGARARAFLAQYNQKLMHAGDQEPVYEEEFCRPYLTGLRIYANNRRVFITRDGRLGLGPAMMQPGDEIVVLFGGRLPFVARRQTDHHVFIGQCYLVDEETMWGKLTEQVLIHQTGPKRVTYRFL